MLSAICPICYSILRACGAPFEELFSASLGSIKDIKMSKCNVHQDLIDFYVEGWEEEGYADHILSVFKLPRQSYLELLREDLKGEEAVLYSEKFELVGEDDQESRFGRGRILDSHWIRPDTIEKWLRMCKDDHSSACSSPSFARQLQATPAYLIDTKNSCLTRARPRESYMALSYVWGRVHCLQLKKNNLKILQKPQALRHKNIVESIPRTILHAIDLALLLGEKYLWVDSLCIVQDDEDQKRGDLLQMAAIYASASITIVAADGLDATYGLRGIQKVSDPVERKLNQHIIPVGRQHFVVRTFPPKNERDEHHPDDGYYSRAWTFQEYFFSKRHIVFEKNSVLWTCCSTTWFEDVDHSDGICLAGDANLFNERKSLTVSEPSLSTLTRLVSNFNCMQLTYDGDCLDAFAGITTALNRRFEDGFLCGLPEMFFDVAMLWQPVGDMQRRHQPKTDTRNARMTFSSLPSWSWAGWKGTIDTWSWQSGCDFNKTGSGASTSRETIPITTWFTGASVLSEDRREIKKKWYIFRSRFRDPDQPLPEGWARHVCPGVPIGRRDWVHAPPRGFESHFYTHVSCPGAEFWYPVPIKSQGQSSAIREPTAFLFGAVDGTWLYTNGFHIKSHTPCVSLTDALGQWAGVLRPHSSDDFPYVDSSMKLVIEVVAISLGRARNSTLSEPGLEEWDLDERPKIGEWYEFYNVMWISWNNGIASRKGLGRTVREVWERQKLEKIELVLE